MAEKIFNYVYKITRSFDEAYYYGIHSTDDLNDGYFGSGPSIIESCEKYGKETHSKCDIAFFTTRTETLQYESELVNERTLCDDKCLNRVVGGGSFPLSYSDDMKKKMSEKSKDRCWIAKGDINLRVKRNVLNEYLQQGYRLGRFSVNDFTRKAMSDAKKGKKLSDEHRRKISAAGKGRKFNSHSREKISQALKGRAFSNTHKENLSETHKGQHVGYCWISNGINRKRIHPNELNKFIDMGYRKGMQ